MVSHILGTYSPLPTSPSLFSSSLPPLLSYLRLHFPMSHRKPNWDGFPTYNHPWRKISILFYSFITPFSPLPISSFILFALSHFSPFLFPPHFSLLSSSPLSSPPLPPSTPSPFTMNHNITQQFFRNHHHSVFTRLSGLSKKCSRGGRGRGETCIGMVTTACYGVHLYW